MQALIGVELLRKLSWPVRHPRHEAHWIRAVREIERDTHTYFANYNRTRWLKLGTTATLTAPEAREAARDALR